MKKKAKKSERAYIRRAQESDINQICELRTETLKNVNGVSPATEAGRIAIRGNNRERFLKKMVEMDTFCLVEDTGEGEQILGTIDIRDYKTGYAYVISGVFVRCDQLRNGYGTVMMNFIEKYAVKKGAKAIRLSSTHYAREFYLSRGYQPMGNPEFSLTMQKTLERAGERQHVS